MRWELGQKKDAPFQPQVKMSPEGMGIATGLGFADALGAVSLLGETLSPLLLVADNNASNGDATKANIGALVAPFTGEMTKGYIFGGTAAVSEEIEEWLTDVIPAGPLPYIYETPEEIVRALYLLNPGEELSEGYSYELTGTVTEIFTPYSEKDQNLSVTMVVEGMTDKPILCFQLKADPDDPDMANALPGLKAGDTITVWGKLTNLGPLTGSGDLRGFGSYCRMISYEEAAVFR